MQSKTLVYAVLSALFWILSLGYVFYFAVIFVFMYNWTSLFTALLILNLIVIAITLIRGRQFPLYVIINYLGVSNCVLTLFVISLFFLTALLPGGEFNLVMVFSALLGLLVVWYLQVSLFFIKPKLAAIAKVD